MRSLNKLWLDLNIILKKSKKIKFNSQVKNQIKYKKQDSRNLKCSKKKEIALQESINMMKKDKKDRKKKKKNYKKKDTEFIAKVS